MSALLPYVVVVDDPHMPRGHRVAVRAINDAVARRMAVEAAVAADWFDVSHGGRFDEARAMLEHDGAVDDIAQLWAIAFPADAHMNAITSAAAEKPYLHRQDLRRYRPDFHEQLRRVRRRDDEILTELAAT